MTVRSVGEILRGARRAGEVGYRSPPYSVSRKCISVVRFAFAGRVLNCGFFIHPYEAPASVLAFVLSRTLICKPTGDHECNSA